MAHLAWVLQFAKHTFKLPNSCIRYVTCDTGVCSFLASWSRLNKCSSKTDSCVGVGVALQGQVFWELESWTRRSSWAQYYSTGFPFIVWTERILSRRHRSLQALNYVNVPEKRKSTELVTRIIKLKTYMRSHVLNFPRSVCRSSSMQSDVMTHKPDTRFWGFEGKPCKETRWKRRTSEQKNTLIPVSWGYFRPRQIRIWGRSIPGPLVLFAKSKSRISTKIRILGLVTHKNPRWS